MGGTALHPKAGGENRAPATHPLGACITTCFSAAAAQAHIATGAATAGVATTRGDPIR